MIKVVPTEDQIKRAKELFEFKALNNSITKGDGNIAGALGEVIVCDHYKATHQNTYDYDLIIQSKDGEPFSVDVKTKRISPNITPQPTWFASVAAYNIKQRCDYYCFVGLATDFSMAYIYGFIQKDNFYKQSYFGKKGELDPYGNGTWTFRADCYNLFIKDLLL